MTHDDPFATLDTGEKTPSVSWQDATPGTSVTMHATEWPEQVQTTDFNMWRQRADQRSPLFRRLAPKDTPTRTGDR